MFDILQIIYDSNLVFYAALLAVSSFLLAEFKVKKLNTKLIVCAVLMIIYVISTFVVHTFSSYLVCFIFMFFGMFSISVFIGFAIDTVFRLFKKKD